MMVSWKARMQPDFALFLGSADSNHDISIRMDLEVAEYQIDLPQASMIPGRI